MNRATFPRACQVMFIAVAFVSPVWADGFDPAGARALFRDLGVSLGPGYHHPPCLNQLRQHYDMAVAGQPLPASKLTPLYKFNRHCMQASRYVPLEGPSSAFVGGVAYQGGMPSQAIHCSDVNRAANGMVPLPSVSTDPAPWVPASADWPQRGVDAYRPTMDPNSMGPNTRENLRDDAEDFRRGETTRSSMSFDSPFEPYSPNDPIPDEGPSPRKGELPAPRRGTQPDAPWDTEENRAQTSHPPAAQPSPPPPASTFYDGSRGFDDVEIADDLIPANSPLQHHPQWDEKSAR